MVKSSTQAPITSIEGHYLSQQLNVDSMSPLEEQDRQSSLVDSQDISPNTKNGAVSIQKAGKEK